MHTGSTINPGSVNRKKSIMRYTFSLLSLCIVFLSCQKDMVADHSNASAEYFPNSVGNYWRYQYSDSVSGSIQMVDVNITGSIVLPGGQNANIWTYSFPDHADTNYVFQVGNTISFMNKNFTVFNSYVIPLQLNNAWKTTPDYRFDSIQVTDNASYVLNGHHFDNSFLLSRNGYLPNEYWSGEEWVCPNIGMISKRERSFFSIANEARSAYWELVSYDLK